VNQSSECGNVVASWREAGHAIRPSTNPTALSTRPHPSCQLIERTIRHRQPSGMISRVYLDCWDAESNHDYGDAITLGGFPVPTESLVDKTRVRVLSTPAFPSRLAAHIPGQSTGKAGLRSIICCQRLRKGMASPSAQTKQAACCRNLAPPRLVPLGYLTMLTKRPVSESLPGNPLRPAPDSVLPLHVVSVTSGRSHR
jgi:hypothetical protein